MCVHMHVPCVHVWSCDLESDASGFMRKCVHALVLGGDLRAFSSFLVKVCDIQLM